MFGLEKQRKIQFLELLCLPRPAPLFFRNFDILYSILNILTLIIQIFCLVTYFCAQAVFEMPFSNTFLTQKEIEFQIVLVLDGVKLLQVTERFRQFSTTLQLSEYIPSVNYFLIHPVCLHLHV